MKRIPAAALTAIAILLLPVAGLAQQPPGSGQPASAKQAGAREAAIKECRDMFGRTGRGAADNTAIRIEQCVKDKLGKK